MAIALFLLLLVLLVVLVGWKAAAGSQTTPSPYSDASYMADMEALRGVLK